MRSTVLLVIGGLMLGIGAVVLGRLLVLGTPVTGNKVFDAVFGVFFLLRGVMNVQAARRARGAA